MSGRLPEAPTLLSNTAPRLPQSSVQPMSERSIAQAGAPQRDLAARIGALAERFDQRADQAAAEAGRTAGAEAGNADPNAAPTLGGGIWRNAYERGAAETAGRRLEVDARTRMAALAEEHAADPVAFERAAAEYRERLLANTPALTRARVAPELEALAGQFRSGIAQAATRQMAEERVASFNDATQARVASIERLALAATRDPTMAARLDAERTALLADTIAMGPKAAFTFDGRTYPADPTRAGALTPVQMQRLLAQTHDTEREGIALGAFRSGPRSDAWIAEFERRELDPGQRSGLRPDQVARLTGTMRTEAARDRARAREDRADAREALTPQIEARRLAIFSTGTAEALPPIPASLIRRAGLNPETVATQERTEQQMFVARQSLDDPEARAALAPRLAPGGDLFAADPRRAVALAGQVAQGNARTAAAELAVSVADAQAEQQAAAEAALAAGRAAPAFTPVVTVDQARAAGQTPEWATNVNRQAANAVRLTALTAEAATAPPERLAAIEAELAVAGPGAAANREALDRLERVQTVRVRAQSQDPAAYAVAQRPELARMQQAALAGVTPDAMTRFVAALNTAQAEMGVPEGARLPLPRAIGAALVAGVTDAPDAERAFAGLLRLRQAVQPAELARIVGSDEMSGGAQPERREAVLVAGALLGREGGQLSRDILRGALVLRDNPLPGATAARIEAQADSVLGNAFALNPTARSQAVAAARALYAAEAAGRGETAGTLDTSRFRRAIERVVPLTRYNGATLPLPPGMDAPAFSSALAALPDAALTGAQAENGRPITPGQVARGDLTLQAIGPGRYLLGYDGRQVRDGRTGAQFVLDLNGVTPTAPAPRGTLARTPATRQPLYPDAGPAEAEPPPPATAPAAPRDPNAPIGARIGLGGSTIDNRPVGSTMRRRVEALTPRGVDPETGP